MLVTIWLLLIVGGINGLFVEIGEYPQHLHLDLNLPTCGMRVVPSVVSYPIDKTCFQNPFPNQTMVTRFGKNSFPFHSDIKVEANKLDTNQRVFNGRDAMVGESPWTVGLEIEIENTNENGTVSYEYVTCSGSLITFEWILTAAHCFETNETTMIIGIHVWAGAENEPNSINLDRIILPEEWETENDTDIYDIALIKTRSKFTQTEYEDTYYYSLNTICLPNESELNLDYEQATFAGWGVTYENGSESIRLQIEVTLLLPNDECYEGLLCSDDLGNQPRTCEGDSGGPLIQFSEEEIPRAILVGALRGGEGNCSSGIGTTEWNPPMRFIPWILDTIANY